MFLQLQYLRIRQIVLVGLRINQQQENRFAVVVVLVGDTRSTALAFTRPRKPYLPQSSGTLDNPLGSGASGQKLQQVVKAGLAKQLPGLFLKGTDRDKRLHQL